MKKYFTGALIGFVMLILFSIFIVVILLGTVGVADNAIDNEIKKEEQKINNDLEKLEVKNLKQTGDTLTGTIKNNLDYDIDYLEINFKFYDKDGITVNDDMSNKTDFVKGEVWKFDIYLLHEFNTYEYDLEMSIY